MSAASAEISGRRHPDPHRVRAHLVVSLAHCPGLLHHRRRTAAPWEASNSARSLKRDAARAARHGRRRFPQRARMRAHAVTSDNATGSHQPRVGHRGRAAPFMGQNRFFANAGAHSWAWDAHKHPQPCIQLPDRAWPESRMRRIGLFAAAATMGCCAVWWRRRLRSWRILGLARARARRVKRRKGVVGCLAACRPGTMRKEVQRESNRRSGATLVRQSWRCERAICWPNTAGIRGLAIIRVVAHLDYDIFSAPSRCR